MRRRSWLKLGVAAAAVLAVGGGALAIIDPGLRSGRLTEGGRRVFRHVGRAVLEGTLPADPQAQSQSLDGLLLRVDGLIAALPGHAQQELAQLVSILDSAPGRRLLAGLPTSWEQASTTEIQAALQSMRTSSLILRRQAYQALHDITGAAYFSDPGTWSVLGYPGPMEL